MMPRFRTADAIAGRLAAIIDSSDDAIVSKTLEGRITSWNRAAERIFGYTEAEVVGKHITLIIPEDRWPEEEDVLARIRRGERVDHFETIRVTKDGRRLFISLTVSPIKDDKGRIVGASKVARDITDRRLAEQERNELLERERQARAEAEAVNQSKDQFVAVLSHELRTPLNAIFGWARLLTTGNLDPVTVKRATDAIVRNATAQMQLIEDLLDMSRIITGNMRLNLTAVDLKVVVEAALDAVRPAADAKGVRLQTVMDPRAGAIIGAAERLQQVAWNLLTNAVKFTPKGGRVQVYLRRHNSHVELIVSDTGEGISPDILPFIFERFRQGDSSTTRPHGGLGIGLALVRHLVDLHGGTVKAESAGVGEGATFTVRLPVTLVQPEPPPREQRLLPEKAESSGPAKSPSLVGLRVLVVDDDVDGLDLATMVLTNCGAEVRTCVSAAAALQILEAWRADVLISDIEMPEEDGYTLLRKVRARGVGRGGKLPAVALTAYGRAEDRIRALEAGFNLHLAKPTDPAELAIAVASVAGRTG